MYRRTIGSDFGTARGMDHGMVLSRFSSANGKIGKE